MYTSMSKISDSLYKEGAVAMQLKIRLGGFYHYHCSGPKFPSPEPNEWNGFGGLTFARQRLL